MLAEKENKMKTKIPLLLLEDEVEQRQSLVNWLKQLEFPEFVFHPVFETGTESGAKKILANEQIEFVLLDNKIPESPGLNPSFRGADFIKELRNNNYKYPILMLTGQTMVPKGNLEADIVGDPLTDYVSKEAGLELLGARLHSLLKSYESSLDAKLKIGRWYFSPGRGLLEPIDGGRSVSLAGKLSDLLFYLYKKRGKPASLGELQENVWNYSGNAETHTPQTHVYRLRELLEMEDDRRSPKILQTVGKKGYRLNPYPT